MADDGESLDWISERVVSMLKAPTWVAPIAAFVDENCIVFEDAEENKLEYTTIHGSFNSLVDDLLAVHLSELAVTTEQFMLFCQRGLTGENEVHRSLVEQLISVDDFLVFKAMMVKRNADLRLEAAAAEAASDEAQQIAALQLEAERLEMERQCLEAGLQLMAALSVQLEQRLQLAKALNELVEAVAKMEAMAAEATEEGAFAVPADVAALPAKPAEPPTLRVQPLREEAAVVAAAPPVELPPPAPAPARPTEEERRQRAEHLKRQREMILEKKRQEREASLSTFQQSHGPTPAARAAERACARSGTIGLQQPHSPDADAGRRLAAELSGAQAAPAAALPDPEAAAKEMRRTLARQLKQTLVSS